MDQNNENYGFLDLLRDAWRLIGKYVGITFCTVLVYFIGLIIIGIFFPVSDESFSGLLVTLAVTNCTGYLSGKLNRILQLLEEQNPVNED